MVDLGSLVGRPGSSIGNAMNNLGEVVGISDASLDRFLTHPFIWRPREGRMHDLGSFGGLRSEAHDINDRGEVVGESELATGVSRAFLWTRSTGMIDLGILSGGANSSALAINNLGEVVGTADTPAGEFHIFLWTAAGGMIDLGGLPGFNNTPWDISDRGQIVGIATSTSGSARS